MGDIRAFLEYIEMQGCCDQQSKLWPSPESDASKPCMLALNIVLLLWGGYSQKLPYLVVQYPLVQGPHGSDPRLVSKYTLI